MTETPIFAGRWTLAVARSAYGRPQLDNTQLDLL
jgi:hypothetical protein